ncbi:zinc finger protein 250-like [Anopheles moucheti]|uniref:zinc finger protein 250-like n=1 Tax=Anopheles moucheti TaxID=186751 RepID=UPI0022F03B82|nr:zinc finger protein 250-like [Anopheles moucheti]
MEMESTVLNVTDGVRRASVSADRGEATVRLPKCYVCGDRFPSEQELDQHLDDRHASDLMPYWCDICDFDRCFPIRSMRAINKHFALHDVHERMHQCSYCALRFRTERNLQSHVRLYHRGGAHNVKGEQRVLELESVPSTRQNLPATPANRTGKKRFQCCHCGNTYTTGNALKRHENTHTLGVRYACQQCGKVFAKLDCLTQHERIHSQTRPYACDQCPKTFIQLAHLRIHKRARHSGERPHLCGICNRGFRARTALTVHGRIHTGEKPFRCAICSMQFSDAGTLRKHGAVHREKQSPKGQHVFLNLSGSKRDETAKG